MSRIKFEDYVVKDTCISRNLLNLNKFNKFEYFYFSKVLEYKEYYTNISLNKEKKRDDYLRRQNLLEGVRSFSETLSHDLLYITFSMDYMGVEYQDTHSAFFITLTLDTVFHSHIKIKKNKIKYEDDHERISEGYKLLQESFRKIYKDFKVDRKRVKDIHFGRVIEPHNDYTPHLHSIIYIPKGREGAFLSHYNNILKLQQPKGLGKQHKIELLRDIKKGSGYITKYIKKGLLKRDFDGWKRNHNIRVFTYSKNPLPKYLYNIISGRTEHDKELMKNKSYFHSLLDSCYIKILDYDYTNKTSLKLRENIIGNSEANFGVFVYRELKITDGFVGKYKDNDIIIKDKKHYRVYDVRIIDKINKCFTYENTLDVWEKKYDDKIFDWSENFHIPDIEFDQFFIDFSKNKSFLKSGEQDFAWKW